MERESRFVARRDVYVDGKPAQATVDPRAEVRLSNNGRRLSGYALVFGKLSENLGGFVEQIKPGAAIELEDVRCTFNHSAGSLLGRQTSGTLSIEVDDVGLRYEVDLPNTSAGADVRELVRRGDVDGSSFMFDTTKDSWSEQDGVRLRTLESFKVYELGPVVFPAYPDTTAAVRALRSTKTSPAGVRAKLEARRAQQRLAELLKGPRPDAGAA